MKGPVLVTNNEDIGTMICFYENDDSLIQFNPEMRFGGRTIRPLSFSVGTVLKLSGGTRSIEEVQSLGEKETEALQSELSEALKQAKCIQTAKVVSAFRYKLK